jgi:hypothetical protein
MSGRFLTSPHTVLLFVNFAGLIAINGLDFKRFGQSGTHRPQTGTNPAKPGE